MGYASNIPFLLAFGARFRRLLSFFPLLFLNFGEDVIFYDYS